jgi:hypothetical protein
MKIPILLFLLCGLLYINMSAQSQDPEFPKNEFIMHLKLHNGMVTNFHASPDVYVGGVQLVPQFTVVENRLRIGVVADGYYTGKKLQAAAGPTLSFKIKTFELKKFGSGGNINLSLDHLWGTEKQHLFGGGVNIDLLNFIVVAITAHRDYNLNSWWLQGSFGFRISKVKQPPHP